MLIIVLFAVLEFVRYLFATVLFDSGADFIFISTKFVHLLNVKPSTLRPGYVIEVANGKKVETDRIIRGMDWLSRHKVEIVCHEKVVRIPLGSGKTFLVKCNYLLLVNYGYLFGYITLTIRMPNMMLAYHDLWDKIPVSMTRIMKMKPDIENMTLNEYLEYEAAKERRLWDNIRSRRSPTNYDEADVDSFHRNKTKNMKRMGQDIVQDSIWKQDNDLEEDREDDGDDRDTFDIWEITV
ncbi:hypothetical protein Tco_0869877 [Tanacetum coccineum]